MDLQKGGRLQGKFPSNQVLFNHFLWINIISLHWLHIHVIKLYLFAEKEKEVINICMYNIYICIYQKYKLCTCIGWLSSSCLFPEWTSPSSLTCNKGFILGEGPLLSLVLWNKPHPKNAVTKRMYTTASENSTHLTCMHQKINQVVRTKASRGQDLHIRVKY